MTRQQLIRYLRFAVYGETHHPRAPRRKPRRGPARSPKYRAWIRTLPSAVSGCYGCEAAHTGSDGGMRQKASDYSCIPLTTTEHREYRSIGKPRFELKYGIECAAIARKLSATWFEYAGRVK